ncbi:hypothetical protein Cri9333_0411 [Crinalium epipsammum PCC 9333]|uniref:Uncharacterized protein n=1 Tax=Crinalium epipsammum PCC 9333 TaxID=1173022 RepID=K9VUZ7_9CYAN|nr:hypothetical protein [Crinalium epipsammum]AFZ11384.1 hypothetical protein Cri9333_0411 [Crinalium epipsammum PCC 9333]
MTVSQPEQDYFQTFINAEISESDAVKAAQMLLEIDEGKKRTTTREKQIFLQGIFYQINTLRDRVHMPEARFVRRVQIALRCRREITVFVVPTVVTVRLTKTVGNTEASVTR